MGFREKRNIRVKELRIVPPVTEFFKDKEVFVIGGGYAAAQESVFLTRYASHVTIIMREKSLPVPKSIRKGKTE